MTGTLLLQDLGVILIAAAVLSLLTRPLQVPGVVAYMLAGILLGPVTGLVEVTDQLDLLAELGVALLLFLVGLELSVERVKEVGGVALAAGGIQVVVTFAAGLALALGLGFSLAAAVVTALALTFSSTAVVVKLLGQKRELVERHGRIALGILLVQDVAVVLALTLVGSLGGDAAASGAEAVVMPLLVLAGMSAATVVAARHILPPLFRSVGGARETVFVWSLSWCLLFVLISEHFHLPVEVGGFLAGVALAQLHEAHDLSRRVAPLTNFFLAVFFVALGIRMDPAAAAGQPGVLAVLVLFAMPGKAALFLWILARRGEDERVAFRTAVSMAQMSEFSFVLAGLAAGAGLLSTDGLSLLSAAGLLTIAASSFVIVRSDALYQRVRENPLLRLFGARPAPEPEQGSATAPGSERGHVIVVGMNALGRRLVRELADLGETVVAVDRDREKLEGLPVRTILGDVEQPDLLTDARAEDARLLVSALQIEETNKLLAHRCRRMGVPVAIHAFNPSVEADLQTLDVNHLMTSRYHGAQRFVERLRELGTLHGS